MDILDGQMRPNHKGRYVVRSGSRKTPQTKKHEDYFKEELVTPTAHAVEMAKSEWK